MSDNDPVRPRGASAGGLALVVLGWLLVALGVGLVVLQVVMGTLTAGGVVLSLFVMAAGAAPIAVGRGVAQSRES
ncbi:MAG TPA: hypothetical protein VM093_09400 [Aeromicrobium sp.]|nr:hypothetical protein [Aeromicrobium sp.]